MLRNKTAWVAWGLCGVIVLTSLFAVWTTVTAPSAQANDLFNGSIIWAGLVPIVFALVGALILFKQPGNAIGWLVMLPALATTVGSLLFLSLQGITTAPENPSLLLFLAIWFGNTIWVWIIFPLFFIALLFPTGKPLSPRWRWVIGYGIGLIVFFYAAASLVERVGPDTSTYNVDWTIQNPIGLFPQQVMDQVFGLGWGIAVAILAVFSIIAPILRYRRAKSLERQQLKWLLAACVFFALSYIPAIVTQGNAPSPVDEVLNALLFVGILGIPIAMGIAILRYRLFDIDIIIRRTVTYTIVVTLLGIIFFGSVILLQQLFARFTDTGGNEIITVISTLVIAALFVPLRNKIQDAIDKRFNRRKYDAQKVLQKFSETVRDETDIDKLTAELLNVVNETMQPAHISLWLKKDQSIKH